jgi:disulfide bond formation protein DsbB
MKRLFAILGVLALVLAACGGDSGGDGSSGTDAPAGSVGDASAGQEIFDTTCVACHGADAKGLPGLGRDLTSNAFIAENSDDEMVAFLEVGRPADHPDNENGVQMPPKGGNPALSDDDLYDVVAYLNTLPGN